METYHIYFTTVATGEENVALYEAETENHARTFFFEDFGSEVVIDGVDISK